MFCAPKPSATPTIDVPAMNGGQVDPSSPRISSSAITKIVTDTSS